jgi:hypothetical protein
VSSEVPSSVSDVTEAASSVSDVSSGVPSKRREQPCFLVDDSQRQGSVAERAQRIQRYSLLPPRLLDVVALL